MKKKRNLITKSDVAVLKDAIKILRKHTGIIQNSYIKEFELLARCLQTGNSVSDLIHFENADEGISDLVISLFDAIENKYNVNIQYNIYLDRVSMDDICPYHLTKFGNTWSLLFRSVDSRKNKVIDLENILKISPSDTSYIPYNDDTKDIIHNGVKPSRVLFWASKSMMLRLKQRPINKSQKLVKSLAEGAIFEIIVYWCSGLKYWFLKHSDQITIIQPYGYRDIIFYTNINAIHHFGITDVDFNYTNHIDAKRFNRPFWEDTIIQP